MILTSYGLYKFSIFEKFPEIIHGVSTKKFGNVKVLGSIEAMNNMRNLTQKLGIKKAVFVIPEQIHGGETRLVRSFYSDHELVTFPQVDGLITRLKGLLLLVTVADCYPILAFDPVSEIIGVAHAGWRGVKAQIAQNLISEMKNAGTAPENIVVGIGPGICVHHYEVKNKVAAKFDEGFLIKRSNRTFLDLPKAIISQLLSTGVKKENIEYANICVFEDNDFFSFRREGKNLEGEQAAIIGLKQ